MIPEHVLAAAKIIVARQPVSEIPQAVQTIREHGKLTQNKLSRRLLSARSTVANWETGQTVIPTNKTSALFRVCGFPEEVISSLMSVKDDNGTPQLKTFDSDDIDLVEFDYFNSKRFNVLRKLGDLAEEGDNGSIKLFTEWMVRNRATVAARVSNAIPVSDDSIALRSRAIQATHGSSRRTEPQDVVDNPTRTDVIEEPNVVNPAESPDT